MRYIKNGQLAADPFVLIEGDEPAPSDVPVILSAEWLLAAAPEELAKRSAPLGVSWPNDRPESDAGAISCASRRSSRSNFRFSATGGPTRRRGSCASATASRARSGRPATCFAISFFSWLRAGFDAFEVKKDADAEAFAEALRRVHRSAISPPPMARRTISGRGSAQGSLRRGKIARCVSLSRISDVRRTRLTLSACGIGGGGEAAQAG